MTKRDEHEVLLRLTPAEALVLFEWLSRVDGGGQLPIEDPAETHVLWRLEGQLESCLSCLLYTSPSPRDRTRSRMPSSA